MAGTVGTQKPYTGNYRKGISYHLKVKVSVDFVSVIIACRLSPYFFVRSVGRHSNLHCRALHRRSSSLIMGSNSLGKSELLVYSATCVFWLSFLYSQDKFIGWFPVDSEDFDRNQVRLVATQLQKKVIVPWCVFD